MFTTNHTERMDRIRERWLKLKESREQRRIDAFTYARLKLLASAYTYAGRAEKFRARKEANTRPADLLTDSQRSAIDNLKGLKPSTIARQLGLCKEYVDDYLATVRVELAAAV